MGAIFVFLLWMISQSFVPVFGMGKNSVGLPRRDGIFWRAWRSKCIYSERNEMGMTRAIMNAVRLLRALKSFRRLPSRFA